MDKNSTEKFDTGTVLIKKNGFFAWIDNFWYHYKWHTLISLFLVFALLVCTLQMCRKESYDMHILYAGGHAFERQSEDADTPEYFKAKNTLSKFVIDYDGNDEINISFRDLFVPDNDSMKDLEDSYYYRAYEDRSSLGTLMVSGDHYLCFISSEVYENYKDSERLASLKPYVAEGVTVEYYDTTCTAIKLSSIAFSELSGFSELPEDTLICLRSMNFSTHLDKKSNQKEFDKASETLRKILNYGQ